MPLGYNGVLEYNENGAVAMYVIERQAKGPVMTHVKRLHQGKVSLQHLALPAARPKRVPEGSSIRSANKVNKVWVSADTGNPFYTDELGNVLES